MYNYYDNRNSDLDYVNVTDLKKLPQFFGMTDKEIEDFIHSIDRIEKKQWIKESRAALLEKRNKDLAYIEEHGNTTHLSSDEVKVDRGVKVRSYMDKNGFITDENLNKQCRQFRLSLDKKPSLYIPYIK